MANDELREAHNAPAAEVRPSAPPNDLDEVVLEEEPEEKPSRLEQLAARLRRPSDPSREVKATERTRALVILGVTSVACVLLFIGLFTTDSASSQRERRTKPNLGRPEQTAVAAESANRSAVPNSTSTYSRTKTQVNSPRRTCSPRCGIAARRHRHKRRRLPPLRRRNRRHWRASTLKTQH